MGTALFHANGWTDMTKLIVVFRNFVKAPQTQAVPVSVMKAHMGSGITSPLIHNLGFRWNKGLKFTPRPLNSQSKPALPTR